MRPFALPVRFALSVRFARSFGVVLLSTLSFGAGSAFASPGYPSVLERDVPMACTPDCTVCHTVSPGLGNTSKRPFSLTLQNRVCLTGEVAPNCTGAAQGLLGGESTQTLVDAIARIKAAPTDSDADGIFDIDELNDSRMGITGQMTTDPNTKEGADAPSANVCPAEPAYGCGAAHVAKRPHVHTDYLLLTLAGGLLGAGLWRRLAQRRSAQRRSAQR